MCLLHGSNLMWYLYVIEWGRVSSSVAEMSALPPWKLAILARKKKQEEDAKVQQAKVEEAKLASMPPWKRAILLREKQVQGQGAVTPKAAVNSTAIALAPNKISSKWQVAVQRVKGPDSPILKQKQTWQEGASTKSVTNATGQVTQRWKHAFAGAQKLAANSKSASSTVPAAAPLPAPVPPSESSEQDNDLSGMPAWKRALILKKRKQQQKPASSTPDVLSTSKPDVLSTSTLSNGGVDEPDSAATASTPAPKPQQPEVVVHRREPTPPPQRLLEQEGKTLRAPVYKEVDEWANVKEEDDKFKGLPLWKQALIKRRRADIAKRSGLPTTVTSTVQTIPPTPKEEAHSPLSKKAAPQQKNDTTNTRSARKSTAEQKKIGRASSSKNKVDSTKAGETIEGKSPDSKPVRKARVATRSGDLKPARKAPQPARKAPQPARKAPQPPSTKKDPMFTYNFSKSTRHTLDTGASSSDSTDSELEDAVVTNLDDSDEGDSGIVLQHYSANKPSSSSPNLGQKSHSDTSVGITSVLSTTRKKKGRVSRMLPTHMLLVLPLPPPPHVSVSVATAPPHVSVSVG